MTLQSRKLTFIVLFDNFENSPQLTAGNFHCQ